MFANLDSERRLRTVDQTMIDLMFVLPLVNQVGFRSRRLTTDQIFIVWQLFQKTWEFNKETLHFLLFSEKLAPRRFDKRID